MFVRVFNSSNLFTEARFDINCNFNTNFFYYEILYPRNFYFDCCNLL
jgi:hypothetical protein